MIMPLQEELSGTCKLGQWSVYTAQQRSSQMNELQTVSMIQRGTNDVVASKSMTGTCIPPVHREGPIAVTCLGRVYTLSNM